MGVLCNGYSIVEIARDTRAYGYVAKIQTPSEDYVHVLFSEDIYILPEEKFLEFIKCHAESYYEQHQEQKKGGACVMPENWETKVEITRRLTGSLDDLWIRYFTGSGATAATTNTETTTHCWRWNSNPWVV